MPAHNVTAYAMGNRGTVVASPSSGVNPGYVVNLTYTPNAGYIFDRWYVYAVDLSQTVSMIGNNAFIMPDSNVTAVGYFKSATGTHTITVSVSGSGGTASAYPTSADFGTNIYLTATPETGYSLDKWIVTGVTSKKTIAVTDAANDRKTFVMPDENVTATCSFKSSGGGGGGGGGGGSSTEGINDIKARAIPVPNIVAWFDAKDDPRVELDEAYHSRADYLNSINKHGAIYKLVNFSEVSDAAKLKEYAMEWIRQNYYDGVLSFTVKAVDLHLLGRKNDLNQAYSKLLCGDQIEVEFIDGDPIDMIGPNKYINLTPSSLSTAIDLKTPNTQTGYRYAVVGCESGDWFTITAKAEVEGSGSNAKDIRAYAFLDSKDKIVVDTVVTPSVEYRASANATLVRYVVMAPENAVTLVINDKSGSESFVGNNSNTVVRRMTCLSAQYDLIKPENSSFKIGIPDISANLKYRDSLTKKISTPQGKKEPEVPEDKLLDQLEQLGLVEGIDLEQPT